MVHQQHHNLASSHGLVEELPARNLSKNTGGEMIGHEKQTAGLLLLMATKKSGKDFTS